MIISLKKHCSSSVGAFGSIATIFSYMSFLSLGFSRAFANSSSKYVLIPILQSIMHGEELKALEGKLFWIFWKT